VLVEEGLQMTRELYLSIVLDRAAGKPAMMASAAGGMDIEEVAAATPQKIVRVYIEPGVGLVPFEARQLGFAIGLDGPQVNKAVRLMTNNPGKIAALEAVGVAVAERVPCQVLRGSHSARYLKTKKKRMGHLLEL